VVKKIKRAVTDSGTEVKFDESRPAINNLLTIYQLLTNKAQLEIEEHFSGKGYGALKAELAEATVEFLKPFQERFNQISDEQLDAILERGADRARDVAAATMVEVKERMGLEGLKG
jgi:tryptophanyl-tRNA synthetase